MFNDWQEQCVCAAFFEMPCSGILRSQSTHSAVSICAPARPGYHVAIYRHACANGLRPGIRKSSAIFFRRSETASFF